MGQVPKMKPQGVICQILISVLSVNSKITGLFAKGSKLKWVICNLTKFFIVHVSEMVTYISTDISLGILETQMEVFNLQQARPRSVTLLMEQLR